MIKSLEDYVFVIPARAGSKGVPFKNRKLIKYTISSIPENLKDKVIIATDDDEIKEKYSNFKIFNRSKKTASDTASTKSLMMELKDTIATENIILLYLTYPQRNFEDVLSSIKFYEDNDSTSLLCSKKLCLSPYLMMHKDGIKGRQIINHDLYRRQDYPECFELSHYICIFNTKVLEELNNNLYKEDTIFYPIDDVIDVDTKEDLEKFHENKNNR